MPWEMGNFWLFAPLYVLEICVLAMFAARLLHPKP